MGSVLINIVILALWGVSNESETNFRNSDTSHITPNPIALTNKVIKVVPSYFCVGVYCDNCQFSTKFRWNLNVIGCTQSSALASHENNVSSFNTFMMKKCWQSQYSECFERWKCVQACWLEIKHPPTCTLLYSFQPHTWNQRGMLYSAFHQGL